MFVAVYLSFSLIHDLSYLNTYMVFVTLLAVSLFHPDLNPFCFSLVLLHLHLHHVSFFFSLFLQTGHSANIPRVLWVLQVPPTSHASKWIDDLKCPL